MAHPQHARTHARSPSPVPPRLLTQRPPPQSYEELRKRWLSAFQARAVDLPGGAGPDERNPWCRVEDLARLLYEHSVASLKCSEAQQVAELVAECTSYCAEGYVDLETFREA